MLGKANVYWALWGILITGVCAKINFQEVPDDTPMIINKLTNAHLTYDSYTLVYYANLQPFFKLREQIRSAVEGVKNIHMATNKPTYISAAGQLEHQLELMYADEERLMSHRARRYILCEYCGKANHFLFGVLNQDDAKRYDNAINNLQNATKNNRELMRNQSRVFEAAVHFTKNVYLKYENKVNELNERVYNQSKEMKEVQLELTEQSLIQIAQLLFSEYYRIFGQIRRTLADARNGKVNELIPKQQLTDDLTHLIEILPSHQRLPIDPNREDIFHIFKFSSIRSTLFAQKLMVEVNIPIAEKERYFLFKAIPIPMRVINVNVITTVYSTFFLLNWERTKYIPMSMQQMDNGVLLSNGDMIYKPTVTTLLKSNDICEWQILINGSNVQGACQLAPFPNRDVIMTVLENQLLFMSFEKSTMIYETCNDTHFDELNVQGRGTIKLDTNCIFKTDHFMVRPHKIGGMNPTQIILPIIGFDKEYVEKITQRARKILRQRNDKGVLNIIHNSAELGKIMDMTKDLVENANREWKFEEMQSDSNQFSFLAGLMGSLSIFGMLLTIGGVVLCKCNLFNCLLKALIKRGTNTQIESDGSLIIDLPQNFVPKPMKFGTNNNRRENGRNVVQRSNSNQSSS